MPLPIVHLQVAKKLLNKINIENISDYYLGAISPDSVHMRECFTPDCKSISHFKNVDIASWKNNALHYFNCINQNKDFNIGYCVHILTDIVWSETVYSKYLSDYEADNNPIQDKSTAYYNDTAQLDFILFKEWSDRPAVWKLLTESTPTGIEGIVFADEVEKWKDRTLHWFDSGKSKHSNPIKYIKLEDINSFVAASSSKIFNVFYGGVR